jgi:WD40 repeat protein
VTSVDIAYDGMVGVTAGQDRMIFLWDFQKLQVIREISLASMIAKVTLTPMAKFVSATLIDGTTILYETLTGITWRTERIDGKHSGISISNTNYMMEVCHEGLEHKMAKFLARD